MPETGRADEPPYRQLRKIEAHADGCQQCQQALTAPRGQSLLCPEGDQLVMDFHRGYYQRHMAMVQARKKRYGRVRDPLDDPPATRPELRRAF